MRREQIIYTLLRNAGVSTRSDAGVIAQALNRKGVTPNEDQKTVMQRWETAVNKVKDIIQQWEEVEC